MAVPNISVVLTGLQFPECPRWHDGRLWLSDMLGRRVISLDADGQASTIKQFDSRPSGLGFLPDGTLIVALYYKRILVAIRNGIETLHADLTSLGGNHLNDMVIDRKGRAYVGLRMRAPAITPVDAAHFASDCLVSVDAKGSISIAARDLVTPNGMALTADGSKLILNESRAERLRSFSVAPDGSLSAPVPFASLPGIIPDGLCADQEGAVWVATLDANRFDRISPDGRLLQSVSLGTGRLAIACVLGGRDRKSLYMMTKPGTLAGSGILDDINDPMRSDGCVEVVRVEVPGAGVP